VDGAGGRARGYAELVAQHRAEVGIDAQGFGDVALGRECAHQQLVAAFAKRRAANKFTPGAHARRELGPSYFDAAAPVRFECTKVNANEPGPLLVDPGTLVPKEELPLGGEQRSERRAPCAAPIPHRDGGLRPVDGFGSGLEVNPGVLDAELQGGTPIDSAGPEHPAELRHQRVEGAVGRRRGLRPDRIDQLGSADGPVPVAGKVGEHELSLLAGKVAVESSAVSLDDERAAQVDPERRGGGHANIVATRRGRVR
jgi:hypothetical protein